MGLKWEYELASYTQAKTWEEGIEPPSLEKNWDAAAFVNFTSHEGTGIFVSSKHHPTQFGTKLYHTCSLPAPEDPLGDRIKDALIPVLIQALEGAVLTAIATGSASLVITLPSWVPAAILVLALSEIARRAIWKRHPETPLMNIRLVCPTQEIFDAVDHHFQGCWEL